MSSNYLFDNHLLKACFAAVFALGLAACSSSSSDTASTTDDMDMSQDATADEQIAELQKQINALRAELGLDPIDIDSLADSVSDLQGQVADLNQQIADRDKDIDDAAAAAMTAKGKAIYNVLATFGADPATDADAEIAGTAPTVTAEHGGPTGVDRDDLSRFVTALNSTPTVADSEFESAEAEAPTVIPMNGGFSGTMLGWDDDARTDTMIVYTDISAPSGRLFSEAYGNGGQSITSAAAGGLNGAQTGVTGTAFDGRTGGLVEHAANAKSATTVTENDVVKLSGRYKNAMGSYTCTPADGAACTSTVNSDGSITFSAGDGTNGIWTFTANTGAMVSVPDGNGYMTFGWWMRDNKATASPLDNVAVFYSAAYTDADGSAITSTNTLTGTAKYEGGAAGKYAWRNVDEGMAHGGHFTAKASLTADFTAGVDGDTLSGSISDFRIGDDGMDPNWTVTLSEAAIPGTGTVARAATVMTTWDVGGNKAKAAGGWEAQLSNSGPARNDNLPTGVAGAFNATFGEQGAMVGAFGANITNANPPN